MALQNDATITRYNDTLTVNYTLTDAKGTESPMAARPACRPTMSCPRPTPPWSAQQDTDKRAAEDIAERIRMDLGVFFRQDGR